MPPTVQSFQDILAGINAGQAPQYQQIDKNIGDNEQTAGAQKAGLDAAETGAFGKINQEASNKGMFFSGFTPASEATYTGSTYLPALARLQTSIQNTRNTLLGQKATLQTEANKEALATRTGQQDKLDAYNMEVQREKNAADQAAQERAFQATENAKNRTATANNASARAQAKGPTMNESILQGLTSMYQSKQPAFYTENVLAPAIAQAYGITPAAALKSIYSLRKQYFNE